MIVVWGVVINTSIIFLVEQELLTLPKHLCSSPDFSGFALLIISFLCSIVSGYYCLYFTFGHYFLCLSSDSFWLHIWTIYIKKYNESGMGQRQQRPLIIDKYENWVEKTNVLFCSNYNLSTHFRNLRKVVFFRKRKVRLTKYNTCLGQRLSVF